MEASKTKFVEIESIDGCQGQGLWVGGKMGKSGQRVSVTRQLQGLKGSVRTIVSNTVFYIWKLLEE